MAQEEEEIFKGQWYYKDSTGKVFGSYNAAQMEYWTSNEHFPKDTLVATSAGGVYRKISDLGKRGFRFDPDRKRGSGGAGRTQSPKKSRDLKLDPVPILRSTSWTRPERLDSRSEEGTVVGRKIRSEIETWIESRKIKIERESKDSTGTNIILGERMDPFPRKFRMLVGRKKIAVVLHHPETFQRGRSGQFLLRPLEVTPESEKLCDTVNDFARRNCFNMLGQSLNALLEKIVLVYESMFAGEERFDRFREVHGLTSAESPSASATPTKKGSGADGELTEGAAGRSLKLLAKKRTCTVDAFKRTWARTDGGNGRRGRRSSSKFVTRNSFLDEIDRAASPRAATLLRQTKRRLLEEIEHVFKSTNSSLGVDVDIVDGSPFHWRVILSSFNPSSLFAKDLDAHAKKHNLAEAQVRVDIRFPAEFPNRPPEVRLVRPILRMYTGMSCGGAFALAHLRREGWEADERVLEMILEIKKTLETSGRVEIDANAAYPRPAFEAALSRINTRTKDTFENAHSIEGTFFIYSGSIARNVMSMKIPDTFESGNKVLLPGNLLEKLRNGPLSRSSSSDELTSGFSAIMRGGGLVFEITTPMGMSTFCGVLQFNAPESNMIVAPDWMIKNMFAADGMEVQLRSVELPKLTFLKVQPRKADWSNLVAQTGMDPQTFMQQALQHYVSLSKGDSISLSAFGEEMPFSVIEIKPNVPAGRLFDGFFAEVAFDVAKPLLETDSSPASKVFESSSSSRSFAKTLSTQERERQEANERFERRWRDEQERKRRADRLIATEGMPVDNFDESKEVVWRLRLRAYDGSSFIAKCSATTTCDKLHSLLQKQAPTGLVPYTLVQEGGSSVPIPNESGTFIRDVGISDEVVLTQRLSTSGPCDACIAKRPFIFDGGGEKKNNEDEAMRRSSPRAATRSHVFGEPKELVKLCDLHRCKWLETMLQCREIQKDEDAFLTKAFVLGGLNARII